MIQELESILTDDIEQSLILLKSKINEIIKIINSLKSKSDNCPECKIFHNIIESNHNEKEINCVCKCHE